MVMMALLNMAGLENSECIWKIQRKPEVAVSVSRADVYLEVRKRMGHIFFEWHKCLCEWPSRRYWTLTLQNYICTKRTFRFCISWNVIEDELHSSYDLLSELNMIMWHGFDRYRSIENGLCSITFILVDRLGNDGSSQDSNLQSCSVRRWVVEGRSPLNWDGGCRVVMRKRYP